MPFFMASVDESRPPWSRKTLMESWYVFAFTAVVMMDKTAYRFIYLYTYLSIGFLMSREALSCPLDSNDILSQGLIFQDFPRVIYVSFKVIFDGFLSPLTIIDHRKKKSP